MMKLESERGLSVVIPCYNEKEAIPHVLKRWRDVSAQLSARGLGHLELIVVDDASSDGSQRLLEEAGDVKLIRHQGRMGYGAALCTGFRAAQGDLIAFYDMDATYDPDSLWQLIEELDQHQAHVACGDRLSQMTRMPLTRKIGNTFFVLTIGLLYGARIKDSCTGLRVFRREMKPFFCDIPVSRLNFSLAMTLLCLNSGLKQVEVPIRYEKRIGKSKLSLFSDGPRFLWMIVRYRFQRRRLLH